MSVKLRPWTGNSEAYLDETAKLLAELEPQLRAFTAIDLDAARDSAVSAEGPLAGMPIAVKEIIDVAGAPVTFGSQLFADRIADADAEAVARLRAAGAVVLGMTTTTPFACGTTTVTANPHALAHTPGGSSAGAGASVGAGMVPIALGSQSQASTLRPASYCGAWGFKPSHLRMPREGMRLLADTLDDLGIIAASIGDLVAVSEVLLDGQAAQTEPADSQPLRVGVLRLDDGNLPDAATRAAFDEVLEALASAGLQVARQADDLAGVDAAIQGSGQFCFDLFAGESAPSLAQIVDAGEPDPRLAEMVQHAAALGEQGLATARARREELRHIWASLAPHYDALITLATTGPAPVGHATTGCRRMPATSSLLGIPALSAPWMRVNGLPQGVQLLGFDGGDERLLGIAGVLDACLRDSLPSEEKP